MKKIRINVLARELEVKFNLILELLPELGVSEKLTHSSSIDEDVADKLRVHYGLPPIGNGEAHPAEPAEANGHGQTVGVEEHAAPEVEHREPPKVAAPVQAAHPPAAVETEPEPPVAEAPARPSPPIRPPIAAPARPAAVPAKPLPMAPRPGQILSTPAGQHVPGQVLSGPASVPPSSHAASSGAAHAPELSGPRQPFPGGLPEGARAPVIPRPPVTPRNLATPPGAPQAPRTAAPPAAGAPGLPTAPKLPMAPRPSAGQPSGLRPPTRPGLVGQPAQRPVVPPRPDLVARLSQPKPAIPGQPAAPRPAVPMRPHGAPVPGQPIYKGPIRA